MTANVQRVFQAVQQLSPAEQLELIQAISQSLLRHYQQPELDAIPPHIKRTPPLLISRSLRLTSGPKMSQLMISTPISCSNAVKIS